MTIFDPVFPIPLILLLVGAAALLACYREFRPKARAMRPAWFRWPALVCRLGALAVFAYLLMNPSRSFDQEIPASKPLVLIDGSDSMMLKNADSTTRWEKGLNFVKGATRDLGLVDVRVFSDDVSEVTPPEEAEAGGGQTLFASSLEKVLSGTEEVYDPIIVVSDGRPSDRADLGNALELARQNGVTLGAYLVGDDSLPRNAAIASVVAPDIIRAQSRVNIKVSLDVTGFDPAEEITLEVRDERNLVVATREVPAGITVPVAMSFESELTGQTYQLTLKHSGEEEISLADNSYAFDVDVAVRKIRVLMVEGTHVKRTVGKKGHWWNDLRLLTDAWDSSGDIEYELITATSEYANEPNLYGVSLHNGEMKLDLSRTFPKTREELYKFDVMMISDIPVGNFSKEQMQWVVDWVTERGAGFLMAGGYRTFDVGNYDKTSWEKIIPVDMLEYGEGFSERFFEFTIPEAVKNHPLWVLDPDPELNQQIIDVHPNFIGMNRIRRAKPGALVLAERTDAPGEPVIAIQKYGRGRSVAFMPDLNGGWARHYIGWGPEGGPVQGAHTELGHGESFRFKEDAAKIPEGPAPPHPAPYYGRYWVNMVNWLGANSVRWRDDHIAGRISQAHATPGKTLSVAAEVLAVIDPKRVADLDVAARFDLPGSPRVRLEYDRDRREYLGDLFVPGDLSSDQLSVLFEVSYDGKVALDQVKVSVQKRNPEYVDPIPDREFLSEFVSVTGGKLVESPLEAVTFARGVLEKRSAMRTDKIFFPLWSTWPIWAVLATLLGVEWLLRRKGHRATAALAIVIFACLQFPSLGQEESKPDIPALIHQLGADRVRLRDEAEAKLIELPESYEALEKTRDETKNEEQRLRAINVIKTLKQMKWLLVARIPGANASPSGVHGLAVSPDKKRAYTRCKLDIVVWDLKNQEKIGSISKPTGMWGGWRDNGPAFFLALSPDGETLIATDSMGSIFQYQVGDASNLEKKLSRPNVIDEATGLSGTGKISSQSVLWSGEFFAAGKKIVTGNGGGDIEIWDFEKGSLEKVIPRVAARTAFSIAISPDEKYMVASFDEGSALDHVWLWSFEEDRWVSKLRAPRISGFVFNKKGDQILAAGRGGGLHRFSISDGLLTAGDVVFGLGNNANAVVLSHDEKSAFVGLNDGKGELVEVELETGEILWRSSPMNSTVHEVVMLSETRILALHTSGDLTIWEKRR